MLTTIFHFFFRSALLMFFLVFAVASGLFAGETMNKTTQTIPYQQAIREAEQELEDREQADSAGKAGWGLSEVLSITALLAALGLMIAASRWSRRLFFKQARGSEMRLLDRMAIGRQSSLILVSVRDRVYWLADSSSGVSILAELPADKDKQVGPAATTPVTSEPSSPN